MSQETRGNSIFWSILLRSKLRSNLPPRGFMQFGALIDHASRLFRFMSFYRLCIPASYSGGRVFETGEEKIFKLNRNKGNYLQWNPYSNSWIINATVPIIVVFTKFDLFVASLSRRSAGRGKISLDVAETRFQNEHGQAFEKATHNIAGKIPYTTVASTFSSEDASSALISPRSLNAWYITAACRNYDAKYSRRFKSIKPFRAWYGTLIYTTMENI